MPQLAILLHVLHEVDQPVAALLVFHDVVVGALFEQLDGYSDVLLTGEDDDRQVWLLLHKPSQYLGAIHVRQLIVKYNYRRAQVQLLEHLFAGGKLMHLMIGVQPKQVIDHPHVHRIVFDHEDSEGFEIGFHDVLVNSGMLFKVSKLIPALRTFRSL